MLPQRYEPQAGDESWIQIVRQIEIAPTHFSYAKADIICYPILSAAMLANSGIAQGLNSSRFGKEITRADSQVFFFPNITHKNSVKTVADGRYGNSAFRINRAFGYDQGVFKPKGMPLNYEFKVPVLVPRDKVDLAKH